LSIVRQIVEMHGGTVRAESEGEGKGATFSVRLPFEFLAAEAVVGPHPVTGSVAAIRILVVDDDDDTRAFLARILTEHGAQVATADSVTEALRLIEDSPPQVLISDLGMPGRDGYDLIRAVRTGGRCAAALPAIALTAFTGDEERDRALRAGFQVHLTKPAVASKLWSAIVELVHRRSRSATAT
jgi:CheY-like chemotaxis protein